MKAKELLRLLQESSDTAEVKVENGEIVVIEPNPIEYKFKVGDKVRCHGLGTDDYFEGVVTCNQQHEEIVTVLDKADNKEYTVCSYCVELIKDITERIKTFEDAVNWCKENGHSRLVLEYNACAFHSGAIVSKDIIAYLKLRIITTALNEGWEPTFAEDEERWHIIYDAEDDSYDFGCSLKWETAPNKLVFKSERLALYAAKQFHSIYADFCGCKKGGEV